MYIYIYILPGWRGGRVKGLKVVADFDTHNCGLLSLSLSLLYYPPSLSFFSFFLSPSSLSLSLFHPPSLPPSWKKIGSRSGPLFGGRSGGASRLLHVDIRYRV